MKTGAETGSIGGRLRKSTAARALLYLLAVAMVFSTISILCETEAVLVPADEPGETDLTDFDFENSIARVATESTASIFMYPGAFYTSKDFAAGRVPKGVLYERVAGAQGDYGTLRMLLKLPQNETYAIAGKSVSYAQRLFIDGREYDPVGVPGAHIDAVVPQTKRFFEGFSTGGTTMVEVGNGTTAGIAGGTTAGTANNATAGSTAGTANNATAGSTAGATADTPPGTTEFIFHYSAFVHADGGGLYPMDIGLVRNMVHDEQLKTFRDVAAAMTLLTATLFFFGLFLFFPKGRYLLWFSLACACIALRGLLASDKTILPLLPDFDWFLAIRLEMLLTCAMALFFVLYLSGLFPGAVHRPAMRGFKIFCAATALFVCLVQPVVFTRYTTLITGTYAAFGIYVLVSLSVAVLRKKLLSPLSKPEQWLLLAGIAAYAILSALGVWAHQWSVLLLGLDFPSVGMMLFLFLNILALTLGFARTERTLDETRRSEREMEETNRMLERLNRVRAVFITNIGHEIKTPLAGINAMAQYIQARLRKGTLDAETDADLSAVIDRSEWLSDYVDRLLKQAMEQESKPNFTTVSVARLLWRTSELSALLLSGRNNRLTLKIDKAIPPVSGVEEMLLQVLLNLVSNANRHSEASEIVVAATVLAEEEEVEIRVTDYGDGVPEEILPHVFQRGVSGDGGSGLGLSICRDIVDSHGGELRIKSDWKKGTEVWFALPLARSEAQ